MLLDLVPNHTSDQHKWFESSRLGANSKYKDFYVWKDPAGWNDSNPIPPNNWVCISTTDKRPYFPELVSTGSAVYYHSEGYTFDGISTFFLNL